MQEESVRIEDGTDSNTQMTVSALIMRIRQLEEENAKLRNAIIYQWLNGNKDE